MADKKPHILVVEDDRNILGGLLDVLVFNGYKAQGVEDGAEGLQTALEGQFDLLILDVMLPSMDGFQICRELRKAKPFQAIIMLTAKGAEDDVVTGFKSGADDYVSKPFSIKELMVRIEAILRRVGKGMESESFTIAGIYFDGLRLEAVKEGIVVEMTRKEIDIVTYLAKHRDNIVSKEDLLRDVWQYKVTDIETRTVDIHIQKLRKKLSRLLDDGPLIITVRGEGYRLA